MEKKRKKRKPYLFMEIRITWEGLGFMGCPVTKVVPDKKKYRRIKNFRNWE